MSIVNETPPIDVSARRQLVLDFVVSHGHDWVNGRDLYAWMKAQGHWQNRQTMRNDLVALVAEDELERHIEGGGMSAIVHYRINTEGT